MNEYYILSKGQLNLLENSDVVENLNTVRYSLNGNNFVCKTKAGVTSPAFMNPNAVYTHAEILVELAKPGWANNEVL